jgi:hypothetical protein
MHRSFPFAATLLCFAASAFAGRPQVVHHDAHDGDDEKEHYSNQGAHPTKVAVSGITLQSRALLDSAGNTEFELTTGKLDSSDTPPFNITQVEIRALRPEGRKEFEREFENLSSGYFHSIFTGLAHGETLDVEAGVGVENYRGEEGHQDLEFKLQDVVKYRPNMVVQKLDYPPVARPGTAVVFSATLVEAMGDLGGHVDCVLVVDGKPVDAAKEIWIDAASVVTCRLTYTFSTAGLHNVAARIQGCVPHDYDSLRKELGGQIQIQNPNNMFYSSSVSEQATLNATTVNTYYTLSSTVPDKQQLSTATTSIQGRYFDGQIPSALNSPLKASYTDSSGGAPLTSVTFQNLVAGPPQALVDPIYTTVSTISASDAVAGGLLTIQIYKNASTGAGMTLIDWFWDAGVVTYHSEGYCKSTVGGYTCVGGDYTPNTPGHSFTGTGTPWGNGPRVTLASNYLANVVVDDGTSYSARPSMDLVSTPPSTTTSQSCSPANLGGPTWGQVCTVRTRTVTQKSGSAVLMQ